MTIEEMVKLCQECVDDWVDPNCSKDIETMKSIIAALRAGQEMRCGIHVPDYSDNVAELKHPAAVGEACRDWDAVTINNKGE